MTTARNNNGNTDKIIKCIAVGFISKVSCANVNSSYNEGNVLVAKKVTRPDGSTYPYIAGQALRRMLRDRLADLGYDISDPFIDFIEQLVIPPCDPIRFIDEDLFGYMDASGNKKRTSPVRVNYMIGAFPFQGDRDLGTRSFERSGKSENVGGNLFETEIYHNLFVGNIMVEIDRLGRFKAREIRNKNNQNKDIVLPSDKRKERLKALFKALSILWGGGRTARMLSDLSPKFVVGMTMTVKHPVFLEAIKVTYKNGLYYIDVETLKGAIDKFRDYKVHLVFGIDRGVFGNEEEIKMALGDYNHVTTDILSTSEALDKLADLVEFDDSASDNV